MTLQLHSFSELKAMKQHRTPAMAIRFTVCSAACQAVTIWIQKNLPVLERQMARPQGAGILADLTACNALDLNCSKVNLSIFTLLCIHLRFVQLFKSELDNTLDPWFFFKFPFISIQVLVLAEGRQEETPQWTRRCLRETPLYPHGFFRFPFWSAGESFSTSCQSGATRPHCLLHTDLILQPQQDLLYCYYGLPCFFAPLLLPWSVAVLSVCCLWGLYTVFVNGSKKYALPLCCLQQWSAPRTWLSSEHAFYAGDRAEMLGVKKRYLAAVELSGETASMAPYKNWGYISDYNFKIT